MTARRLLSCDGGVTAARKNRTHNGVANDPGSDALVNVAFEKSWRFVENDPLLAHNPKAMLRNRLWIHLEVSLQNGEQDLLALANAAIGKLRAELGTTSGA